MFVCSMFVCRCRVCWELSPTKQQPVFTCVCSVHVLRSQDAKSRGWQVLGAAGERNAVDSATVTVTAPTILVMGEACTELDRGV